MRRDEGHEGTHLAGQAGRPGRGRAGPRIEEPTDAIVRITSTAICGSDLHLYEVLGPYLKPGDVLGHEPMGIVEEVGLGGDPTQARRPGGRAVQHLLRHCWMCERAALRAVRDDPGDRARARARRCSATPRCTARCPAGRPSTCASRRPSSARSRSRETGADERYLYLSDILPTAWQAVQYADVPPGGTLGRLRAGPGRAVVRPDRPAPRRRPGDRRGPRCPSGWRWPAGTASRRST